MFGLIDPQYKLIEVEEILLNKRQHYSASFLDKDTGHINVYEALRYIFEGFLKWPPIQVRDCLNAKVIHLMKMEPLVNRVPCPPELDRSRDFEYVAWHLYPETVNCNAKDLAIKVYHRLLNGEISRFPKGYFDGGPKGWFRARATFQSMLIEFFHFTSLEEMYAFFAGPEGRVAIKQYKLSVPLYELYETPLDYLHDALSSKQKCEELYQKYKKIVDANYRRRKNLYEGDFNEE